MAITVHPIASSSAGNAIILRDGEASILLDCGLPWRQISAATGYTTSRLDGVLVSHEHQDHACGAKGALRAAVTCCMTAGTASAIGIQDDLGVRILDELEPQQVGPWQVIALPLQHEGAAQPAAFLVTGPSGDRTVYVCDTACLHHRVAGVTHWLVEANYDPTLLDQSELDEAQRAHILHGHMSIDACRDLLLANDLSQAREVWLLHLSDRHSDAVAFQQIIEAATGLPTYVAPRGKHGKPRPSSSDREYAQAGIQTP